MPIRFLGGSKNFVAFWNHVDRWMTHLKTVPSSDHDTFKTRVGPSDHITG